MTNLDTIKDRIRKLLNLSNDNAAMEGEVNNAIRFAKDLMDKHNLTEEDITKTTEELTDFNRKEKKRSWVSSHGLKQAQWEGQLALFIAKFCSVGVYSDYVRKIKRRHGIAELVNGEPVESFGFQFYGLAEECDLAAELYDEFSITIISLATLKFGGAFRKHGRSYCDGFVVGLREANIKAESAIKQIAQSQERISGESTALVLIEKRAEVAKAKVHVAQEWLKKEMKIKLHKRQGSSGGQHFHDAYLEGKSDGTKSKVNRKETTRKLEC